MNATMPGAIMQTDEEGDDTAFERLVRIYRLWGLDPDQADTAAAADLACGWEVEGLI